MHVDGNWRLTIDTPLLGQQHLNLLLESDGDAVSGRLIDDSGTFEGKVFNGAVNGDQLRFKIKLLRPVPSTVKFTGTVGDVFMEGRVRLRFLGSFKAKARRIP